MISDARGRGEHELVNRLRAARSTKAAELEKLASVTANVSCEGGVVEVQCQVAPTQVPEEESYFEWLLDNNAYAKHYQMMAESAAKRAADSKSPFFLNVMTPVYKDNREYS